MTWLQLQARETSRICDMVKIRSNSLKFNTAKMRLKSPLLHSEVYGDVSPYNNVFKIVDLSIIIIDYSINQSITLFECQASSW